jgi:hypothetical protein
MEAINNESALTVMLENLPLASTVELRAAIDSLMANCETELAREARQNAIIVC